MNNIKVPVEENKLLENVVNLVNTNVEINTLWKVINTNAITRLGMTDHGPTHFQIVSNSSLRILRTLIKFGVKPSIVKDLGLTNDHAEVVVFLASVMHDLGMSISRKGHEEFSLIITNTLLREILSFIPTEERTILISETLHAIISHRSDGKPLTIEAGIVRVSDALDMTKGRSRVTYEIGNVDIHSVSHQAVEKVEILEGSDKPLQINFYLNNMAGIFQVDDLLGSKLVGSGLEKYTHATAYLDSNSEFKVVKDFNL